ncbi:hypothetical protein ASD11_12510 [Aeromicrobium sp. Root495]|uniref:pilus assembly protein TadG-related protein n=1 Tax=Aeromicrobium sp. Root495 TaxID=1736550 RepID=UPI0006FE5BFC|nr:pilus assembly protein TadG-related protein [Aeromicrobium sp. Root495]KQY60278.1 hypothetical protein ASD11_12510 [Aeromicrobium sp. Root495]
MTRRPGRRWRFRPDNGDESGTILPMTALIVTIVLGFTAFAVDLGTGRVAARDMQAVADAVALDTARVLPSCNATKLSTQANQSFARQTKRIGSMDPLVITPGHIDATTKKFVASTSGACNAVKITARTTVDYQFAPVIGTSSGAASRFSIGTRADPALCFSAGTRAIVLNTAESALGPILNRILGANLSVVGYSGLVDLKGRFVPLLDLDAELKAGTGHGLLDTTTVQLRQLMVAEAAVLRRQGNTAQATLLESVAVQIATNVVVNLPRMLKLDTTGSSALTASVDALDLLGVAVIGGVVQVANGMNAVKISDLGISVANISLANANVTIIEPPVIACGKVGTQAKTAQVRVDLKTGLGIGTLARAADVSMGIRVAQGTATLTAIDCAASSPTATINALTSVADLQGYGGVGSAELNIVTLLFIQLGLKLTGGVAATSSSHVFTFSSPDSQPPPPMYTFGSTLGLDVKVDPSSLLGLGGLVGTVVNPILGVLNAALGSLLTPLLGMFGIKLGTMDVTMLGRPSCNGVKLGS